MWMRLQAIWTMSFKVDEVCERIVQTGLHSDMLANLSWDTLSAQTLDDPKSGSKRDFAEAHIATLHNVVRKTETARTALRQCKALDVVQKFRDCTEFPVSFHLFLTSRRSLSRKLLSGQNLQLIWTPFPQIQTEMWHMLCTCKLYC